MTELLTIGISHKTAPVALRERLALSEGQATGVDVLEDTLKDPLLLGHAYFGLKDAEYDKQKGEPVFEFELGAKKKKGK